MGVGSLYHVGFGDQTQVVRHGGIHPPAPPPHTHVNHLTGSNDVASADLKLILLLSLLLYHVLSVCVTTTGFFFLSTVL